MTQDGIERICRLTPAQQGLLLEALRRQGTGAEISQSVLELQGTVEPELLQAAWRTAMRRHPVLRSSIHHREVDAPVQVARQDADLPWRELDWRGIILRQSRSRLDRLLAEDRRQPFDLAQAPLFRLTLVRAEDRRHWLIWTTHSMLLDGWSHGLVLSEALQCYHQLVAGEPFLPPPARPFWEYSDWLNRRDTGGAAEFWRDQLAGFTAPPPLGDKPPAPGAGPALHAEAEVRVPGDLAQALGELARRCRVTPATVAYAGWAVLLNRYTGRDDVVFGGIVAGRDPHFERVESVAGLYMNNQPVRVRLAGGRDVAGRLAELQDGLVAAGGFGHVPLATALRSSGLPPDAPLFESVVDIYNYPTQRRRAAGRFGAVQVLDASRREAPQYPLCLVGAGGDQGWRLSILYHTDRFSGPLAAGLGGLLTTVLAAMAEHPEQRLAELPGRPPALPVPRRSPPEPGDRPAPARAEIRPAGRELVDVVATLWRQVLDLPAGQPLDEATHFFASGGSSLPALRLLARLRTTLGVDLDIADLFADPTLGGIAGRVRDQLGGQQPGASTAPAPRPDPQSPAPASFGQERLWFVHQLDDRGPGNIVVLTLRFAGELDPAVLRVAVSRLLDRHEVLRTLFQEQHGALVQVVCGEVAPPLECLDMSDRPAAQAEQAARQLLEAEAATRFDLGTQLPIKIRLIRLGTDDTVLGIFLHHIAYDGWSAGVLIRDLRQLYESARSGAPPGLPKLPLQYADFSVWQRQQYATPQSSTLADYWRTQLAGVPHRLRLGPAATVEDRGGADGPGTGGWLTRDAPPELAPAIRELAAAEAVTPNMLTLAAFGVLLARHSGRTDIVVGTPVDDREHPALEPLIGLFVNTQVLRLPMGGNPTFRELMARVRRVCLDALAHRGLPFEKLVRIVAPDRTASRLPLVQVSFSFIAGPVPPIELAGAVARGFPIRRQDTRFELTAELYVAPTVVRGTFNYAERIYRREFVDQLAGEYLDILQSAVAEPDRPVGTAVAASGAPVPPAPDGQSRALLRSLRPG